MSHVACVSICGWGGSISESEEFVSSARGAEVTRGIVAVTGGEGVSEGKEPEVLEPDIAGHCVHA